VPAALLLLPAPQWLCWLGQKPELIPAAASYARINTLGFLPFLWFALLRSLLSSHSRLGPQVLAIVLGNACNALLDYALVFGHFGLPAMGVAGAAWATVGCRWFMFVALLLLSWRQLAPHLRSWRDAALRHAVLARGPLLRLLRLGAPIGAQFALEMGVFASTALLIGWFDAAAGSETGGPRLGGHQVAIQLASLSFMVPLGLGMAASVRVGWAIGRGDQGAARHAAAAALLVGVAVMSGFMLLFLCWPRQLAALLTAEVAILGWAATLIPIAGVFQIGDGLQVVGIGCLRGLGDVRSPLVVNVLGFWLFGLPLGCWLAFDWGRGLGPAGLWWGLVGGLFAVAGCLSWMLRHRLGEVTARLTGHQ
jgi:MATE family multidrug resistance protein